MAPSSSSSPRTISIPYKASLAIAIVSLSLSCMISHNTVHAFPQVAPGPVSGVSGEGQISPSNSPGAAGYSCDASKCQLPNCRCASTDIPGGLKREETPMFITWTNDDAIQKYTIDATNFFLAQRKNPNGCPVKSTYFVSLNFTNHSLVTDWYVAGNEIADHTMTHVGDAPQDEINGNIAALNAFSGIPLSEIQGFRAPYLNYSGAMFSRLQSAQFTYDSSASAAAKVSDPESDAYWPYTLDNGLANNCLNGNIGTCQGQPKIPGMWEIPMYPIFDANGAPHLMDPYLDNDNANTVLDWYKNTFTDHYNGNRQPFGLYNHPIHLATGYPGVNDPIDKRNMINSFLDWAQQQQNVWIITNRQLLAWMKNPVPVSQLNSLPEFGCQTPKVTENICNGMYPNEVGLLQNCPFAFFPWTTCYGCPAEEPTPSNPVPAQASVAGQPLRHRLPGNCSTPFWDPIAGKCLCTDSTCQFNDETKPIGPNGANLIGGGTGSPNATGADAGPSYVPFGGKGEAIAQFHIPLIPLAIAGVTAVTSAAWLLSA